ncbi:MAG: inositol monophosphatase [Alphaproteobacteria bacterium]|nr:inositol monophosphatase [Alphaproteobacteria bacterium]NCQ87991.1 inositol monophosphatase [Alphaproteobacteria bacterium]NCT05502.1 inositol monophosphatase [Alphaproteobacteria bacterium]
MAAQSPIMNVMIKAAEKAARSLLRDFGEVEQLQVSRKGPADFVTAADKRAEEIIFEELKRARPSYSFLMEESGEVKGEDPDYKWIIDPLDGTHNFMHGLPHWCISIALEVKGRMEAAVVYDPLKDEVFRAERSGGAFMRHKRLRVSSRDNFETAFIAFGSSMDKTNSTQYANELTKVASFTPNLRRFGAAALDLSYVAAGRIDGYWERGLHPWDAAAGTLILKEAGGFFSSIDNDDNAVYSRNIVSGNDAIYRDLKKALQTI